MKPGEYLCNKWDGDFFTPGRKYKCFRDNILVGNDGIGVVMNSETENQFTVTTQRQPFNLELYQTGKFDVETRESELREIHITGFDGMGAIVAKDTTGIRSYTIDGCFFSDKTESEQDLFLIPKPEPLKEYWFNVCTHGLSVSFESEQKLDFYGGSIRTGKLKLTFNAQNECVAFENIKI